MHTRKIISVKPTDYVLVHISEAVSLLVSSAQGDYSYTIRFHDNIASEGVGFRQARHLQAKINWVLGRLGEPFVCLVFL